MIEPLEYNGWVTVKTELGVTTIKASEISAITELQKATKIYLKSGVIFTVTDMLVKVSVMAAAEMLEELEGEN